MGIIESMNSKTIIRFVLAAVFATFACIGLLADWPFISTLWFVSWMLLVGRTELSKQVPNKDLWIGVGISIVLIGLILIAKLLHLPQPSLPIRCILATVFWFLWMGVICKRWQKEKGRFNARRAD